MNKVVSESVHIIVSESGCETLGEWLSLHGDDIPQVGICSNCGLYEHDADPDTSGEYCPVCESTGSYSSILVVLGLI